MQAMNNVKQGLLVAISVASLIIVAYCAYFLFRYPSLISLITFFVVVPVFLIVGLGFFRIARNPH
ncbi:hypothetical protein [Bradyrhizobium sp. NBAIM01]|uniref:hypothetical protein n=1 Tax=Bradyrhizobium TaxID=374 RepID=UPI001CD69F71|nr:hypothetical protein [Bradyrhizobium sp. NBAIM01]MCA1513939.1 hypothetical protein [Bradyrhizobium sp. NBAIM01]